MTPPPGLPATALNGRRRWALMLLGFPLNPLRGQTAMVKAGRLACHR